MKKETKQQERVFDMTNDAIMKEVLRTQRDLRQDMKEHRKELQEHIKDGNDYNLCIQRQLSQIREVMPVSKDVRAVEKELHGHKIKIGIMFTVMSAAMLGLYGWVINQFGSM